jgi:hypothetical protein
MSRTVVKRHRCWQVLSSGSGADSGLRYGTAEAGPGAIRRITPTDCERRSSRSNGGKRSWSLAPGGLACAQHCIVQCLFRLARDSAIDCATSGLTRRTAGCGPACPVVWEGRGREASPYPNSIKTSRKRRLRIAGPQRIKPRPRVPGAIFAWATAPAEMGSTGPVLRTVIWPIRSSWPPRSNSVSRLRAFRKICRFRIGRFAGTKLNLTIRKPKNCLDQRHGRQHSGQTYRRRQCL